MSDALAMALVELKRDEVLETVKEKAERGDDPLGLLEECRRGMTIVGDRFQSGEFYLAEMMLAAEIFKGVVSILNPLMEKVRPRSLMQVAVIPAKAGIPQHLSHWIPACAG